MKRIFLSVVPSIAVLLIAGTPRIASAQDASRGRLLYENHCGGCHYERVHQRQRTKVKDLGGLWEMVQRWAPQTKANLARADLEDIVEYLNESHYRFGLPPRKAR